MEEKTKVLFIIHDVYQEDNHFPLGPGYMASILEKSGVKEIVENKINGFLWETEENLINFTLELINDLELREKISKQAKLRSKFFSKEFFLRRFNEIIGL